jgi:proteic killer suppression protein
MIVDFADDRTRRVFQEEKPKDFPADILKRALTKLQLVHVADSINDLRIPPGHRLEQLKGDRMGQHSIRINDQWRICFVWHEDGNASQVEITDYH